MTTVTVTEARRRLCYLLEDVADSHEPIQIDGERHERSRLKPSVDRAYPPDNGPARRTETPLNSATSAHVCSARRPPCWRKSSSARSPVIHARTEGKSLRCAAREPPIVRCSSRLWRSTTAKLSQIAAHLLISEFRRAAAGYAVARSGGRRQGARLVEERGGNTLGGREVGSARLRRRKGPAAVNGLRQPPPGSFSQDPSRPVVLTCADRARRQA